VSGVAFLVRHAEAGGASGGRDADRRLSPRGREAFSHLVAALGPSLGVKEILASPFLRARETAEILSRATGAPVRIAEELASGAAEGREILALARAAGAGAALVGHNPEMAEAVAACGAAHPMPAGTVAAVDVSGKVPRLLWFRSP
jgi:phosphohistidine phosphatase